MRNMLTTICALGSFCVLSAYSYGKVDHQHATPAYEVASYSDNDRALMDSLLDEVQKENLLRAVEHVESHGNPNAISPKGAKGRYQLMDKTTQKPGFGVEPMRNRSEKEQKRFTKDYINALIKHFNGDERLALAAYNGGVGRVDRALARLPKETREYVVKVQQYADNGR